MKFYIIFIIMPIILLCSCSTYICNKVQESPCVDPIEQAKILIKKLLTFPDDWVCIMENEKCIDCKSYLEKHIHLKNAMISTTKDLNIYSRSNCKNMSNFYKSIHFKSETVPPILKDTEVMKIRIIDCDSWTNQFDVDPEPMELYFEFIVNNENQWELFFIGT